jgi:uncharacterized protein (TIGR00290 family)
MYSHRRAIVSWSGGKDSCLATELAITQGFAIQALFCMVEPEADRSRSHALPRWLLEEQAQAMGVPLLTAAAGWRDYEATFLRELRAFRDAGITHVVFGDIDLVAHREWEEKVCGQAGLNAELPLWEWPRERVVEAIFTRGIQALCAGVNTRLCPAELCGRPYDAAFVADLPPDVDRCGENGEFHTCVLDAPCFSAPVRARVEGMNTYQAPPPQGGDRFVFATWMRC